MIALLTRVDSSLSLKRTLIVFYPGLSLGKETFNSLADYLNGLQALLQRPRIERRRRKEMLLIPISSLALLFGILGSVQEINIPEPITQCLFGIAILSIAAFLKRLFSWR